MCGLCPDAVDSCRECSLPPVREDGTRRTRFIKVFYLDEKTWCEHLTAEHGTDSPSHYAHFAWGMHDGDECDCITQDWFKGKPPPRVQNDD